MPDPRYVVTTDLSPASRRGLAVTAAIAECTGAQLDVFCAVPRDLLAAEEMDDLLARVRDEVGAMAKAQSERGVPTACHVAVVKDVADGIVRHAQRVDADLVAVAPQGATGWKKLVFGSITEQVLRKAPRMLLIARGARPIPPKDVLVAVDRSPGAGRALRHAIALCRSLEANLHALWVPHPPGAMIHLQEALDSTVDYKRKKAREKKLGVEFAEWVARFPSTGVNVSTRVEEGDAAATILTQARLKKASLIVMGAHAKSRTKELFVGSVARAVAAAAPQSVLLVRARPPKRR